ncbi:MAG: polysaccharide biosynthesis/export family protein [Rhizobiales bacterium]|nr:polysaccharide biosynthesis/export family protein [Hyphomicrobiales bacterium]
MVRDRSLQFALMMSTLSRARRAWLMLLCFLAALLAATSAASAVEADYRLGPQDKIRVKVWEWRAASGDTFEWTALNGEFTINSAGILAMPLIGAVHAEGATTGEVAGIIADRLKAVAGLVKAPNAAVEIAQYRPFYIVGTVERPGEYPYRPGMSVLQAVSIAGGFYRPDTNLSRFERESIIAQGDIKVSESQRLALIMRRDRLGAEARGDGNLLFSEEIMQRQSEALIAQGMREEGMIFATRRQSLQAQVDLLVQANALLDEELRTLAAKSVTQQKQYDLARRELESINSLMARGLAVSGRQVSVEQNVAQMESMMLDLTLAQARTRQDISRNQRNMIELGNQRANDVLKELRETQVNLDQVTERISTFQVLLYDSQVTGPRQQLLQADEASRLSFQIVRRQDGRLQEIGADASAEVLPGDIIKIQRPAMNRSSSGEAAANFAQRQSAGSR